MEFNLKEILLCPFNIRLIGFFGRNIYVYVGKKGAIKLLNVTGGPLIQFERIEISCLANIHHLVRSIQDVLNVATKFRG